MGVWLKLALAAVLLAGIVGGAQLYLSDPVLLRYGEWQAEPSAAVVLAMAVAALALLVVAVQLVSLLLFFPSRVAGWRRRRAEERRLTAQTDVLRALILEDKRTALKGFARLAEEGGGGGDSSVYAAHAARLAGGDAGKRDDFLRRASRADAGGENGAVVALAQARLAYHSGRQTEAQTLLEQAAAGKNAPPAMLRSLFKICEARGDWRRALTALYRLREAAPSAELEETTKRAAFAALAGAETTAAAGDVWRESLREGERKNTAFMAEYARAMHRLGDEKNAGEILAKALKSAQPSPEVFFAAAQLGGTALCESAFAAGQNRANMEEGRAYLPAMGEIAERLGYWGKARRYYQMANAVFAGSCARALADIERKAAEGEKGGAEKNNV